MSEGRKPVGQTASVGFQIGVRRTFPITREDAWHFLTSQEGLRLWLGDIETLELVAGHKYQSKDGTSGELRVVKPFEQLRMTWKKKEWEKPSTLQIRILPGSADKTTISFHQEKLEALNIREEMKSRWEAVLSNVMEKTS